MEGLLDSGPAKALEIHLKLSSHLYIPAAMASSSSSTDEASSTSSYIKGKPIFNATHSRACSTAFERVMMTRTDVLTCVHEPFGDPFYYSNEERLGIRFGADTDAMRKVREETGYAGVSYRDTFDDIGRQAAEVCWSFLGWSTAFVFELMRWGGRRGRGCLSRIWRTT